MPPAVRTQLLLRGAGSLCERQLHRQKTPVPSETSPVWHRMTPLGRQRFARCVPGLPLLRRLRRPKPYHACVTAGVAEMNASRRWRVLRDRLIFKMPGTSPCAFHCNRMEIKALREVFADQESACIPRGGQESDRSHRGGIRHRRAYQGGAHASAHACASEGRGRTSHGGGAMCRVFCSQSVHSEKAIRFHIPRAWSLRRQMCSFMSSIADARSMPASRKASLESLNMAQSCSGPRSHWERGTDRPRLRRSMMDAGR